MKNLNAYYDVIVVGAGPAGLMSAIKLSKTNLSVLVIEKNDNYNVNKLCAGGLTNKSLDLIDSTIPDINFDKIQLIIEKKITNLEKKNIVGTFERKKLYNYLIKKLSKNIQILFKTKITKINDKYLETQKSKINFKYLIGADGSNSIVRKYLNIRNNKILLALQYNVTNQIDRYKNLQFYFDAKYFGSGYAWIFPHKKYISIGCCANPLKLISGKNLNLNFHKWLNDMKIEIKSIRIQSGIINYDYQGYQFENIFLVGDAGGFANGLTGEGIYYALVSGEEIAKKIINPRYKCSKIINLLKLKYKQERLLQYISKNTFLTKILYNLLSKKLTNSNFYDKIIKEFAYEYNKAK